MNQELKKFILESKLIYNQSLYFLRQAYFGCKKNSIKIVTPSYIDLYKLVKSTESFSTSCLDYVVKQGVIKQAYTSWKSFIRATIEFNKAPNKFLSRPKLPNYLKKDNNLITIDSTRLRTTGCKINEIRLPNSAFKFVLPRYITRSKIKCLRILKNYQKLKIEIIYEKEQNLKNYNNSHTIGIDIGLNNLAAITSNELNFSMLINGRPLKSINQFYNKMLGDLKSKGATKKIDKLSHKRKMKVDNYLHWASRQVISICLANGVSKIVIGKNDSWKQGINLGKRTNQNFVMIPFAKFIQMIQYKAGEVGIDVKLTEESYTSKIDHLAHEGLHKQEHYLGKRTKRGLFKSSTGRVLNADINGAIGILRKVNEITDVHLMNLRNRGDAVSPKLLNKAA